MSDKTDALYLEAMHADNCRIDTLLASGCQAPATPPPIDLWCVLIWCGGVGGWRHHASYVDAKGWANEACEEFRKDGTWARIIRITEPSND